MEKGSFFIVLLFNNNPNLAKFQLLQNEKIPISFSWLR